MKSNNRKTGAVLPILSLAACLTLQATTSKAQVSQSFESDVSDVPAQYSAPTAAVSPVKKRPVSMHRLSSMPAVAVTRKSEKKINDPQSYEPLVFDNSKELRVTATSMRTVQGNMKTPVRRSGDVYNVAYNERQKH